MSTLWNFIKALPALLELFKTLSQRIQEAQTDRKVVDDVKIIHGAFIEKDPAKLNALFNS